MSSAISDLRKSIKTDLDAAIALKVQLLQVDGVLFKYGTQRPDRPELESQLEKIQQICQQALGHYQAIISNSDKLKAVVRSLESTPLTSEAQAIAKAAKTYAEQLSDSAEMCKEETGRRG